jgi:hypothetical protein
MNRRAWLFQCCDADSTHQRLAGYASWMAFSARWRARQGLPLLHPLGVQYLTPQDFCNGLGHPLPAAEQRRLFRQYVVAAQRLGARRLPLPSGDLAFVRAGNGVRSGVFRSDFVYGREDSLPYAVQSARRPYGIPVASTLEEPYWLDGAVVGDEDDNGDESWIDEMS